MVLKKVFVTIFILVAVVAVGLYGYVSLNTYEASTEAVEIRVLESKSYYESEGDLGKNVLVYGDSDATTNIIFYQGGLVETQSYAPLAKALAEEGYQVFMPKMPLNLAIFNVNAKDKIIKTVGNQEDFYMMGHSLGGVSSLMSLVEDSADVDGIILLASYGTANQDISKLDIGVLSILGRNDGLVDLITYESAKRLLPEDAQYEVIEGGNHAYYGNYGEQDGDMKATISREEQQQITVKIIDKFIDAMTK